MVTNKIKHQSTGFKQLLNIIPVTGFFSNLMVINYGKTIIR